MNDKAAVESGKTTGRMGIIGAAAIVVTYLINRWFPETPQEVVAAILFLIGVAYDSYQHNAGNKLKLPF